MAVRELTKVLFILPGILSVVNKENSNEDEVGIIFVVKPSFDLLVGCSSKACEVV